MDIYTVYVHYLGQDASHCCEKFTCHTYQEHGCPSVVLYTRSRDYMMFLLFILSLQLPDFLQEEHHFDVIVLVSMLVLTFDLLCYTVHHVNVYTYNVLHQAQ